MAAIRRFLLRLLSFFRSSRAEAELAREIAAHLQILEDSFVAKGMSVDDARFAARRAFGGVEQTKERQRDMRAFRWIDEWSLDARLGARMLIKHPGLTLVGSLGIAVAIAIGAVFFTVLYGYVQPTMPLHEGDRVIAVRNWDTATNDDEPQSLHDFVTWRDELTSLQDLGAFRTVRRNLLIRGRGAEPVGVAEMTASGFRTARVAPLVGRPLVEDDERPGAADVAVIDYEIWRTRFDGDPGIIGRMVQLGSTSHTVVGVMPERFTFPINHQIWIPLRADPADFERRQGPAIGVFARLAPHATLEHAQAELTTIGQRMAQLFPATNERLSPRIVPYAALYGPVTGGGVTAWQLHLIQSLVSLLLIVVCANVAILIYARTATRIGEISVRTALGASRRRIVAQMFVEALVLSALGAAVGVGLAVFAMYQLDALLVRVGRLPFWIEPGLSIGSLAYVVGLTVLAAIIAGVVPALGATGRRVQWGLTQVGRGSGVRLGAMWTALVVVQVACAVAILPAVVYHGWELLAIAHVDPGFPADEYIGARVAMDRETPPSASAARDDRAFEARFGQRLTELIGRLEAEPAVAAVTYAWTDPDSEPTVWIEVDGLEMPAEFFSGFAVRSGMPGHEVRFGRVAPNYFDVFGASLLAGRGFRASDLAPTAGTAIVNRTFAQRLLHGAQPLGRRFRYVGRSGDVRPENVELGRWFEIVGVVEDFPPASMEPDMSAAKAYHALDAGLMHPLNLDVRFRRGVDPAALATRLREIAVTLDPTLRLDEILPLGEILREEQGMVRVGALAFLLVTISVLLFSAAGIYAMMSFAITHRRREIGIRTALGAQPRRVLTTILSRAAGQLALGVVVGVLTAALLNHVAEGDLVDNHDVAILSGVATLMVVVGVLATLGPACRGLRIDPSEALRTDA